MGYRASLIESDNEIVINKDDMLLFAECVRAYEAVHGHISWCGMFDEYMGRHEGKYETVIADMLEDFGFYAHTEDSETETRVVITGWQGDKIGSAWEKVWGILATCTDSTATWILCGEDQSLWAERVANRQHMTLDVALTVAERSVS